jgi:hypothetical protein
VGSAHGVCGPCGGPAPDGGTPTGDGGGPTGDAGGTPEGGGPGTGDGGAPPPACALFGQICTTSADCCYGLPCVNGRCEQAVQ